MANSYDTFKETAANFTRDEVERLSEALKNKEFRKLLTDYVDEVNSPESRQLYQKEITELEKGRGVDVTFINPVAGYVIKTSVNGNKKCFINICANENIQKPTAIPDVKEGSRGLQWSLPHSLAPPREDLDKKGVRCQVYDVVFHPDTLHLAQKNKAFRNMINSTACEAVESQFDVTLDKKNLKFPKLQYKGLPQAAVIRKTSAEKPPELNSEDKEIMDKLYAQLDQNSKVEVKPSKKSRKPTKKSKNVEDENSIYTTPQYLIKHRRHLELEEFALHKTAKMNAAIPKELVVEVNLPLLKSSADIVLDVAEKTLQLTSEKPAKYKLALTLPYRVNQDGGNAKFDKDQKKLVVTLPVKPKTEFYLSDITRDDSGVDSDHGSLISSSPTDDVDRERSLITEISSEYNMPDQKPDGKSTEVEEQTFLDPNLHYSLPEFTCNTYKNVIAFTLNVKNVDESSLDKRITESDLHIKFNSISASFFPLHYAFYVSFSHHKLDTDKISIEVWDNNVIVQINYMPCDNQSITSYFVGTDSINSSEKYLEEPSIINEILEEAARKAPEEEETRSNIEDSGKEKPKKDKKKGKNGSKRKTAETNNHENAVETEDDEDNPTKKSIAIDIVGNLSESSGDEISQSFSPTKGRGILKGLSNTRRFGRSISESGLDEVNWTSSIENCYTSVDSVIPEEGEVSTSYKKTVRFNDVVSRQLFRSNSSILGQRKKNQRKAKAKKRAQERRHSEGEISSESEDKKERDMETGDECEINSSKEKGNNGAGSNEEDDSDYFASDIFQLDMNS